MKKYFSNFWRNTSGSEIKSVAVKMSDMLEALKQVGNNLEEAWGSLVQEHFSNPVLQVNYSNLITHHPNLYCRVQGPPHPQPALLASASQTTPFNEGLCSRYKNVFSSGTSVQKIHYLVVVVLLPNQYFCQMFTTLVSGMI